MNNVWIGFLCVAAPPGNPILEGNSGAFVNALAKAQNEDDFFKKVSIHATEVGLSLDEILWSEPLDERLKKYDIDEYLLELAKEINEGNEECRFGVFHAWEEQ